MACSAALLSAGLAVPHHRQPPHTATLPAGLLASPAHRSPPTATHIAHSYDIGVAGGLFTKESFLARFYPDFKGSSDSPYCKCECAGQGGRGAGEVG